MLDLMSVGRKRLAIAEGYIAECGAGPEPGFTSHETAGILNASDEEAHVSMAIFYGDHQTSGRCLVTVALRRSSHVRLNGRPSTIACADAS